MKTRLLALDLDGTLLDDRGEVDPRDAAAVRRAQAAGVTVTIATGRIASGALHVARALGMTAPLVCADGALLVDPRTGAVLERRCLAEDALASVTATLGAHGLRSFWFLDDEVHGEDAGRAHADFVGVWSRRVAFHPRLADSPAWARRAEVALAIGVGAREAVEAARLQVVEDHGAALQALHFPVLRGGGWSLLARRGGVDKGTGLARVAHLLGLRRDEVAAVGDWENDVPMFRYAARSFAMGQAAPHVAAQASESLTATARDGGGVAEAVARLLAD